MKSLFFVATLSLVSFEFFSFLLTKFDFFLINQTPAAYVENFDESSITAWRTEQEIWGSWHNKNSFARHDSKCFSTTYFSNAIGSRDLKMIANSYVEQNNFKLPLLGDSFAEGFGVNHGDRAGDIIGKNAKYEVLNYGSVDFGPLQYYLIYKNLVKPTLHDGVLLFLFPNNDFTDNDYSFWQNTGLTYINNRRERWRPYYKKLSNGSYEYFYPSNAVKRDNWEPTAKQDIANISPVNSFSNHLTSFKAFLIDHFYFSNAIRTLETILLSKRIRETQIPTVHNKTQPYSGYYDATLDQQKAAIHYLEMLIQEVGSKPITIFAIPTLEDLNRIKTTNRSNLYWWKRLDEIKRIHSNVNFIDFADYINGSPEELFHTCDGHWNINGNKLAAEVILLKSNFQKK